MPSDVATNTMMRLPASELMTMRDDFLKEGTAGLTLTQFVRVMLRRGRQAQVNNWTQEANKRRMSGLSMGDRPYFDSDNDDVDDFFLVRWFSFECTLFEFCFPDPPFSVEKMLLWMGLAAI